MRRRLKTELAELAALTGADQLVGTLTGVRREPLVLGYHRVVEDYALHAGAAIPPLLVSTAMLEQHLDWLSGRFRFLSLDELGERLESGGDPDEAVAAVTFDDGYSDVYENALPLLKRKGIPGAVFVVSDLVGTERLPLHDRLYALLARAHSLGAADAGRAGTLLADAGVGGGASALGEGWTPLPATRRLLVEHPQEELEAVVAALTERLGPEEPPGVRPMSWEMLSALQRNGITIGSHTRSHALLTRESPARIAAEASGSREILESRLGTRVRHFAYPDGRFDAASVDAVAAAGYSFAYTTCRHRDPRHPLLTIPRRLLWERSCVDPHGGFSPGIMSCHAHGVFDLVSPCRTDHRGTATPRAPYAGARSSASPPAA